MGRTEDAARYLGIAILVKPSSREAHVKLWCRAAKAWAVIAKRSKSMKLHLPLHQRIQR